MRQTAIAVFTSLMLIAGSAMAQNYRDAYQTYQDAVAAGDQAAAIDAAVEAFELARRDGADARTIDVLAQNVIYEALWRQPMRALPAVDYGLERTAVGSIEIGYSVQELRAIEAFILATDERRRVRLEAAADAVRALHTEGTEPTFLRMNLALEVAKLLLAGEVPEVGEEMAALAGNDARELEDLPTFYLATANVLRINGIIVSLLSDNELNASYSVTRSWTLRAEVELNTARFIQLETSTFFPPADSVAEIAPLAAQNFAYGEFISTLAWSFELELDDRPSVNGRLAPLGNPLLARQLEHDCRFKQGKEQEIGRSSYPIGAGRDGYNGVVVLAHDISEDGRATNIRVLAEIPDEGFAKRARVGLEGARFYPEAIPEVCKIDQIVINKFYQRR